MTSTLILKLFSVDSKYTFEIGGRNKTEKQIRELKNAIVVKDDLEYAAGKELPLWMFGMLY